MKDKYLSVVAPAQVPKLGTPKSKNDLPPGSMLHSQGKNEDTILLCWTCKKPIWTIHPVKVLSKFSTEQRPATPIGHKKKIKKGDFKCPFCKQFFAKWDERLQKAQYITDKGII